MLSPHSPQPRHSSSESVSTDTSGIEELVDNVLKEIEEYEEKYQQKLFNSSIHNTDGSVNTGSTLRSPQSPRSPRRLSLSTTDLATETKIAFITHNKHQPPQVSLHPLHQHHHSYPYIPHQEPQYKLFSPNPFYPGQSLPILCQVYPQSNPSIQSSPSSQSTESMFSHHSLRQSLHTIVEDPISKLEGILRDRDDTEDGYLDLEEFEEAIHDIDNAINLNDLGEIFRYISGGNSNELSITKFMKYIRSIQHNYKPNTTITPSTIFRGAFPDIFGDINDEENREIWGDAQMSSIHKLFIALQEEAENEGVIDFPEFEAAINNMGIGLSKDKSKKVFAHFLGEQDIYDKKMGVKARRYMQCDKKYEIKLAFLMDLLKENVENHEHLQPKQILKLAFMELLLNDDGLNKQSSFISHDEYDYEKENESDDSFKENPDFDTEISSHCVIYDGHKNESKMRLNIGSFGKGDRSLMRMGSAQHWTDDDVIKQKQEMEQHYKLMMEQQNQNEYCQ